jgi:hypothetical protein
MTWHKRSLPALIGGASIALLSLGRVLLGQSAPPPPLMPYGALETRARAEGAAAVRGLYHNDLARIVANIRTLGEVGADDLSQSLKRASMLQWLWDYLASWSSVELKAIDGKEAKALEGAHASLLDMMSDAEFGTAEWGPALKNLEDRRAAASTADQRRLGLTSSGMVGSMEIDHRIALERISALVDKAGDSALRQRIRLLRDPHR